MAYLAGTIINNVRDLIPDPVYSLSVPQPDADGGLFRAQTLYRWLDDGVRLMTSAAGYNLTDWTAVAAIANQPVYPIDPLFLVIDQAYSSQLRCRLINQTLMDAIYPGRGTQSKARTAYVNRVTGQVELGFQPVPSAADPATTLNGGISATDTSIVLASTAGFLSYGFVLIESELVRYQSISANTLNQCTRGMGGTAAVAHLTGVAATHCSLWVKGSRSPMTITDSTSVVEVPLAWVSLLNLYLLGMCRNSENEFGEGGRLLKEFDAAVAGIAKGFAGRDVMTPQAARQSRATTGVDTKPPGGA